ncbi:M20/M25/M40 family metallo-hydrolase [Actinophytocola sp.]|uniref:M20/M25/M40 family metallo-hydrolase n=1 Tax=Actinophytocola sp. TaxID=1872138 RepID=UPI003D6AB994
MTAQLTALVLDRTVELGVVPAPPLRERRRAELVSSWWRADGLAGVEIDGAGNVWGRVRAGTGAALVVCAHLDTVFGEDVAHEYRRTGDELHGPGVGDDTVAVATLSTLDALLPATTRHPVWTLATVGEEGAGNLAGVTAALATPPVPIGAMVAVEGNYLGRVNVTGVGSVRWRVTISGPGGHAWERASAPSAIHDAVAGIANLLARAGECPNGTINVGRMHGGEAINARARECWYEVDLRSADPAELARLEKLAGDTLAGGRPEVTVATKIAIDEFGRRPAGHIEPDHPLVRHAVAALERALDGTGERVRLTAASTDANAAYHAGIPAITVGVTFGGGEHTEQEWIALPPLPRGMAALADTVAGYDREEW